MLQFDEPSEILGAVLDQRFRLERVLGQGGLSAVYDATALDSGARVAIKILRAEFGERPEIVERFLNELRASARVDHPSVAEVYEAVRAADGTPYLVMELIDGSPLSARMNLGRLPVAQASGITRSLLEALAVAHRSGVVHRDLKPGNILLLGKLEETTSVKILDFGIALVVDAAGGMQRKTRTGMLLGTPGYMSPEQIRSIKSTDPRADLWSVGVITYEMLTNVPAFEADNEFARITKVLNSEPTPIERIAPQYAHWGPFFRRALSRDLAGRFQTAEEMVEALERVCRGEWLDAPPGPSMSPPPAGASVPPPHTNPATQAQGSMPPAGYAPVAQPALTPSPSALRAFGTSDTAVSPGSAALASGLPEAAPNVQIVQPARRSASVPLLLALVLAAMGGALGFALGFWVGRL